MAKPWLVWAIEEKSEASALGKAGYVAELDQLIDGAQASGHITDADLLDAGRRAVQFPAKRTPLRP